MAVQTNTFKGARYVPKFADPIEWSADTSYEAIESVQHNGFTYLSKQPVPAGVQIDNEAFWLLWADPNAQMEQLRQEVVTYAGNVEELSGVVGQWGDELAAEIEARENADNAIVNKLNLVNPDDFSGTDTQKVQAAFDAISDSGIIFINRNYDISSDIEIKSNSNQHKKCSVIGIGDKAGFTLDGAHFYGAGSPVGGVMFFNLYFKGTDAASDICFNTDGLIRLYFTQCYFHNFHYVFYAPNTIIQTYYFNQCYFRTIGTVLFTNRESYDVRFSECTVETTGTFMRMGGVSNNGIVIDNNCIEGLTGNVLEYVGTGAYDVIFSRNYFEANAGYFDFSTTPANNSMRNIKILDNMIAASNVATTQAFIVLNAGGFSAATLQKSYVFVDGNVLTDSSAQYPLVYAPADNNYSCFVFGNNTFSVFDYPRYTKKILPAFDPTANQNAYVMFDENGHYSTTAPVLSIGNGRAINSAKIVGGTTLDASKFDFEGSTEYGVAFQCTDSAYRSNVAGKLVWFAVGFPKA